MPSDRTQPTPQPPRRDDAHRAAPPAGPETAATEALGPTRRPAFAQPPAAPPGAPSVAPPVTQVVPPQPPSAPAEPETQVINPAVPALIDSGILEPPDPPARSRGAFAVAAQRYELTSVLGEGGMGIVFKAHDRSGDCCVAVKTLKPNFLANTSARRRFIDEAKEMNKIPASARVLVVKSFGTVEQPYYVTEFLPNGTLGSIIRKHGTLPAEQARRFARELAQAVAYIHSRQGKLHRDIKPENVLIDADGSGWLADFGLVWQVGETSVGLRAGTLPYMPPEVVSDERRDVGFEWDLYSVGATIYEMLVGHAPYADLLQRHTLAPGQNRSSLLRALIAQQPPTPILRLNRKASKPLVKIAEWAMARDRRDRYLDADQICNDLDRLGRNRKPLGPTQRESDDASLDASPAGGLEALLDRVGVPGPRAAANAVRVGVLLACVGVAAYFALPLLQGEPKPANNDNPAVATTASPAADPSPDPGANPANPDGPTNPDVIANPNPDDPQDPDSPVDPGGGPTVDPAIDPANPDTPEVPEGPSSDPAVDPANPHNNTEPDPEPEPEPDPDPQVEDPPVVVAADPGPLVEQTNPDGPFGLTLEVFRDPRGVKPQDIKEQNLTRAFDFAGHANNPDAADAVRFKLTVDQPARVWLFMQEQTGAFRNIYPAVDMDLDASGHYPLVTPDRPLFIPEIGADYHFPLEPPAGQVRILAVVTPPDQQWKLEGVQVITREMMLSSGGESLEPPLIPNDAAIVVTQPGGQTRTFKGFQQAFGDLWQSGAERFNVVVP